MVTIIRPTVPCSLTIPNSFLKGEQFEDYVRNYLFPKSNYKLIHRCPGYNQNAKDYAESSLLPDFTLNDPKTNRSFYVECKFRTALIANSFQFSRGYQLERYKSYTDLPFFLILGLGGNASVPDQVFLMNFLDSQFVMLLKRHLRDKEIAKDKPIPSQKLWRFESTGNF